MAKKQSRGILKIKVLNKMKNYNIFLNRDESVAIKGFLTFLIVLGHNAVFTKSLQGLFDYLYTFHVLIFFILPFFYRGEGRGSVTFKNSFLKNFSRLYYPFILFFIILSILFYITNGSEIDYNRALNTLNMDTGSNNICLFINAIFTGNFYLIDYFAGFQYLWFLPVMFSMNLIKDIIDNKKKIRNIFLVLGFFLYIIFFVFFFQKPYDAKINFYLMQVSLFAILQGIGVYFLGEISSLLIKNKYCKHINIMSVTLFIVLTLVYIIQIANDTFNQYELWTYRFIMPFLFFNLLYLIKGYLSKSKILRKIGEYSFSIYLIHPLFCTFSYLLCMKYLELNLIYGIFIQIIVLVISYYISVLWHKITPLRKKTLPRDMKDIFNIKTSKE